MAHIKSSVVLMVASVAFLGAQTDPPGRIGRLNYMDGPVSFQPSGVDEWVDASLNRPLTTNDNIWVGDRGRAEFHIGSAALRLGANTAFQFLNLDDRTVQIRLTEGTLTVRVRNLTQDQIFEIDTPNLAFTLSQPGEYRIDANPDAETTVVTVRDGEGEVTGEGQTFPVYARQQVTVRGVEQISYNLSSAPGPNDWDQWCSSRDRREDQSVSARYVSREVSGYDDLDQYGRWGNQPGYDDVWMPTSVAVGWAPYRDGHWTWVAPWGWTWVDDEPWGFAPYHYGRWASFNGRWGWVPGPRGVTPVYAPALVGWIGGGSGGPGFNLSFSIGTAAAVGWFPLGPREPYFPSYQASQGYFNRVNSSNTVFNNGAINGYYNSGYYNSGRNSNNAPIPNIRYANQNVQNAVTAVPQQSFGRGQRVNQDVRAVPAAQVASARVFAAPAIAPQRESLLGVSGNTSSRAGRPPANVMNRRVVARTPPPPAPVAFAQQQPALAQNPGRPLAPAAVQGIRQKAPAPPAPVRIVDLGRVKHERPVIGASPQGAPAQHAPQPVVTGRQNVPPHPQQPAQPPPVIERQNGRGQEQPPQQAVPQQAAPPQQQKQPQPSPVFERQNGRGQQPPQQAPPLPQQPAQPPPVIERQNGRGREQPPQQAVPQQAAPPQQQKQPQPSPVFERQNGRGQQPPQQAPPHPQQPAQPPPVIERQNGRGREQPPQQAVPQQAAPPQQQKQPQPPPVLERQNGRGREQPPQQTAPAPAGKGPPEAGREPSPQRQEKGKQQKSRDSEK